MKLAWLIVLSVSMLSAMDMPKKCGKSADGYWVTFTNGILITVKKVGYKFSGTKEFENHGIWVQEKNLLAYNWYSLLEEFWEKNDAESFIRKCKSLNNTLVINGVKFDLSIIKEIDKHSDNDYTATLIDYMQGTISAYKKDDGTIKCWHRWLYDTSRGLGCYDENEEGQPEGWFDVLKSEYEKRNEEH